MVKQSLIYLFLGFLVFSSCKSNKVRKIRTLDVNLTGQKINTEKGQCTIEYDELDRFSGERHTKIDYVRIFTFTHEKLKQYFTDRPFIEAYGALSKNGDETLLHLKFEIDTKYIKTGYNGISNESMLRMTLIDGEKVFINNIINDSGKRNASTNKVTYHGVFPISKKYIKLLRKTELDKFGVLWNGGFEEYEVYYIDFIIKQLECLKEIN